MDLEDIKRKRHSGPYDHSLEFNINMYDKLPYVKDESLCTKEAIKMHSGNVVKYYYYEEVAKEISN